MNLKSLGGLRGLRLPRSGWARGAMLIAGGAFLGQALGILASPLITRLYTPQDLGVLGAYTSLLGIFGYATLRFEQAIPLEADHRSAARVLALSLLTTVGVSLLLALLTWLMADPIVAWLQAPLLRPFLWLVPLGIFLMGLAQSFNFWAIRQQDFGRIAQTKLSQGLGGAATQIALGLLGFSNFGLLVGDVVGRFAGTFTLAGRAWKDLSEAARGLSWKLLWQLAQQHRRFALLSTPSSLINSAGFQLPTLLIAALFGAQVAGFFALCQRVVGGALALLSQSFAQALVPKLSQLSSDTPDENRRLLLSLVSKFAWCMLPLLLLGLVAPELFGLVFGNDWRTAGEYVQLLTPMFMASFIITPVSYTMMALGRQDLQLVWDSGRLLLVLALFGLSKFLHLEASTTVLLFSLGMTVSYVILGLLIYLTATHKTRNTL